MKRITLLVIILISAVSCYSQNAGCYTSVKQTLTIKDRAGFIPQIRDFSATDKGFLVCGYETINDSVWKIFVAGYNEKGEPDSSFGVNGIARPSIDFKSEAYAMEVTETNIFIAGCIYPDFNDYHAINAVWCFTKNGLPDLTFNGTGLASFQTNGDGAADVITIQPDGKILCAGFYSTEDFYVKTSVIRFNKNGSPDHTFGNNGIVFSPEGEVFSETGDIVCDSKGRISITGSKKVDEEYVSYVWRLLADGKADAGFGRSGVLELSVSKFGDEPCGIELLAADAITVSGYYYHHDDLKSFFAFCLDDNGNLVKKFCNGGFYRESKRMENDVVYGHFFDARKNGEIHLFNYQSQAGGYIINETKYSPLE